MLQCSLDLQGPLLWGGEGFTLWAKDVGQHLRQTAQLQAHNFCLSTVTKATCRSTVFLFAKAQELIVRAQELPVACMVLCKVMDMTKHVKLFYVFFVLCFIVLGTNRRPTDRVQHIGKH